MLGLATTQDTICDYYQVVTVGQTYSVFSPNYPNLYPADTQCRWRATCPTGYNCKLNCTEINLPMTSNCSDDRLLISKTGDNQLADASKYYGQCNITAVSENQRISLGLITTKNSTGGRFYCSLVAQKTVPESKCRCGYKRSNRIVGGVETGVNEYPAMAAIADGGFKIKCSGMIIDKLYVLTAARCLEALPLSQTAVVVWEQNVDNGNDTSVTQAILAEQFIIHPQFNRDTHDYNIAIIKLQKQIMSVPVCLPFKFLNESFVGKTLTVLSWTTQFPGRPSSDYLQKADLKVISQADCGKSVSYLTSRMICTYAPKKDACQDDSGGPLLYTDPSTGLQYIVGIMSYGRICASGKPGINTRLTELLPWIKSVTPMAIDYCVP